MNQRPDFEHLRAVRHSRIATLRGFIRAGKDVDYLYCHCFGKWQVNIKTAQSYVFEAYWPWRKVAEKNKAASLTPKARSAPRTLMDFSEAKS